MTAVSTPTTPVRPAPPIRQLRSLASTEWTLLLRNRVVAFNSFGMPLFIAFLFAGVAPQARGLGAALPPMVFGSAIVFVVYYTLVTALVARRESLLLKRLRAGEASDVVILAGLAVPFVAIALGQALLAGVIAVAMFDATLSPVAVVFAVGSVLACVAWAALAVASTGVTKSVEHAQITTLPLILIPLLLSGFSIPLAVMPESVRVVAELMPLTPVMQLGSIAFGGVALDGTALQGADAWLAAVKPLLVLVGWAILGGAVARRTMRWEPRS